MYTNNNNHHPILIPSIIRIISKDLPFSTIKNCRFICKIWNFTLIEFIGKNFQFELNKNIQYITQSSQLSLNSLSLKFVQDLKGLGKRVLHLKGEIWVNEDIFSKLACYFTNLAHLDLSPPLNCLDSLHVCLPMLSSLKKLTIRHNHLDQLTAIQCKYYDLPPRISCIEIEYSSCNLISYFPNLVTCEQLEELVLLINCTIKNKPELPFEPLNSVHSLTTNQINHRISTQLSLLLPNLQELIMIGKFPTDKTLNHLTHHMPHLTSIHYNSHLNFNMSILPMKQLTTLILNCKIQYKQLKLICTNCIQLTKFQFLLIDPFNPVIELFENELNHLIELNILNCVLKWELKCRWKCFNNLKVLKVNQLMDFKLIHWLPYLNELTIQELDFNRFQSLKSNFRYLKLKIIKLIK